MVLSGGCGEENDDVLCKCIQLVLESFSNVGSYGVYCFYMFLVSQLIIDVVVLGLDEGLVEGCVEFYLLILNGLLGLEFFVQIEWEVSKEKKCLLIDKVSVKCFLCVFYQICVWLMLFIIVDQEMMFVVVCEVINIWMCLCQIWLGQDIVLNQIIKVLQVDGVYDVVLDMFVKKVLQVYEWVECMVIDVMIVGVSDG